MTVGRSATSRWTIYRPGNHEVPGTGEVWESATHVDPELEPGDEIEVMPVAEHDTAMQDALNLRHADERAMTRLGDRVDVAEDALREIAAQGFIPHRKIAQDALNKIDEMRDA